MTNTRFPTTLTPGASFSDSGPEQIGARFTVSADTPVDGIYIYSPIIQTGVTVELWRLLDLSGTGTHVVAPFNANLVVGDNFVPFPGGAYTLQASYTFGYIAAFGQYGGGNLDYTAASMTAAVTDGTITLVATPGNYGADPEIIPGHNTANWYGVGLYTASGAPTAVTISATTPVSALTGAIVDLVSVASNGAGTKTYAWSQTSGATVSLTNGTTAHATFVAPSAGSYGFSVTVNDDTGTATTTVAVTITDPVVITPPPAPATRPELWVKDADGTWYDMSQPLHEPWQFLPEDYGAKGDGKMLTNVAMTSGSAVLTSAGAGFTSADVGKRILVNMAGPGTTPNPSGALFSTIASVQSSTQVTLAATAARTVSAMTAMFGTDDSAAFITTMQAIKTSDYFLKGQHQAELLLGLKTYVLATTPTADTIGAGGTWGNAQIPLPVVEVGGLGVKPVLTIKGASDGSTLTSWHQTVPQVSGSLLFSMVEIVDPPAGFPMSVIGGPTSPTPFGVNGFNNVLVVIDKLRIMSPFNPGQIGIDMYRMAQYALGTVSIDVFASPSGTPDIGVIATNGAGLGFRTNYTGYNDRADIESLTIQGYRYGATIDQHVSAQSIRVIYSYAALYIPQPGGGQLTHGAWIGYASLEICDYCIYVAGDFNIFGLVIEMLDNEGPVTEHIHDPLGLLFGQVNILPSGSSNLPQPVIVNGAANLEIKSLAEKRGTVGSPVAVPASTTALVNPYFRHATVVVTGGTVTKIEVDGTNQGVTAGPITVPSGKAIKLTYSSAPTWAWVLS